MYKHLSLIAFVVIFFGCKKTQVIRLDQMDMSQIKQGWNVAHVNSNLFGDTLSVNGVKYTYGVGTHAISEIEIILDGKAKRFTAFAGIDDKVAKLNGGTVLFKIMADTSLVFVSDTIKSNMPAIAIDVCLKGIKRLTLIVDDAGDGTHHDHANWLDAKISYTGNTPYVYNYPEEEKIILTPPLSKEPQINGPKVYGCRSDADFLYRIPVSGQRPMEFSAFGLPAGLRLNKQTGIITGKAPARGEYSVSLMAKNALGTTKKTWKIISGDNIALTPPMGWNSWNVWGLSIDEEKVKQAADFMVSSGLADFGFTYINIDDGWEAPIRNSKGVLETNEKFTNMKALSDYVHSKGLKIGIYSSPGHYTCGKFLGSYGYEELDAQTWAKWGIDYLKYDWCSYKELVKDNSLEELQKPYIKMYEALRKTNRDIVYSLCQYGMGKVWEWGDKVGGNLWRTTGDIIDTWSSVYTIGFKQDMCSPYAKPGHWNDPDMLVVGKVGWGPNLRNTRLTANEQYTHISLWALLSAPLLLGCDLTQLDDFTIALLTNNEVLDINQDILGKQATIIATSPYYQIWAKDLEDGGKAIGLFNHHRDSFEICFNFASAKLNGKILLRDVWRKKDIGIYEESYTAVIPIHGVLLLKASKP